MYLTMALNNYTDDDNKCIVHAEASVLSQFMHSVLMATGFSSQSIASNFTRFMIFTVEKVEHNAHLLIKRKLLKEYVSVEGCQKSIQNLRRINIDD